MASVNFDLKLAIRDFQQSLDQANNSVKNFNKDFVTQTEKSEKSFLGFSDTISTQTVAMAAGLLAVATALGGVGISAINAAAEFETMSVQLGVLLGSTKAGEAQLRKLQEFANSSPFELPGVVDAYKKLLAFGTGVSEANRILPVLGDIAAATGKPLADLATIFGQVSADGKLTAERFNQLNDAGIPLGEALAKKLGVPLSHVREELSKGKVSADLFKETLVALTETNGIFAGGSEKQSKTLKGALSSLSDAYNTLLAQLGKEFLPIVKDAVNLTIKFSDSIGGNIGKIKEFISTIVDVTKAFAVFYIGLRALPALITLVGFVANSAGFLSGLFSVSFWTGLGGAISTVITWLGGLVLIIGKILSVAASLIPFLINLIPLWGQVALAIGVVATVLFNLDSVVNKVKKTFLQLLIAQQNVRIASQEMLGVDTTAATTQLNKYKQELEGLTGSIKEVTKAQVELTDSLIGPDLTKLSNPNAGIASPLRPKNTPEEDKNEADEAAKKKAKADELLKIESDYQKSRNVNKQVNNAAALQIEAEGQQSLIELINAYEEQKRNSQIANSELTLEEKQAAYQVELETRIAQQQEELVAKQALEDAKIQQVLDAELLKASIIADAKEKEKAQDDAYNKATLARVTASQKQQTDALALSLKQQKQLEDKAAADKKDLTAQKTLMEESYLNSARGYIGAAMTLAKQGSKEAKLLAITDATIATYLGATKAFASVPYPANFIAAGSIIAGGLANVAKITSSGSFANGGFIGGSSFRGDKLTANVNSGEAVLNVSQQKEFMRIANGNAGSSDTLLNAVNALGDRIASMTISLIADDTEIARSASRGIQNGIELGRSR